MEKPKSYCEAIVHLDKTNVHRIYHDTAYGFAIEGDNELFERLILEINQAGLSWTTILNKRQNFLTAFHQFDIKKIASYKESDRQRRLKIDATIHNANVISQLQKEFGSFKNWLDHHHPKSKQEWIKLFKQTFKFTGGEIVNEFLVSTGYLPGAHIERCSIYKKVIKSNPPWLKK